MRACVRLLACVRAEQVPALKRISDLYFSFQTPLEAGMKKTFSPVFKPSCKKCQVLAVLFLKNLPRVGKEVKTRVFQAIFVFVFYFIIYLCDNETFLCH